MCQPARYYMFDSVRAYPGIRKSNIPRKSLHILMWYVTAHDYTYCALDLGERWSKSCQHME